MRPYRRARASATIGEERWFSVRLPCLSILSVPPVMLQASPALFDDLSQAASDLHVLTRSGFAWGVLLLIDLGISSLTPCTVPCASIHSLARLRPFVATSSTDKTLFSKICRFLAVHSDQTIQGRIVLDIPVGGRQQAVLNAAITSLMLSHVAMWTTFFKGTLSHTSRANGHIKKVWIAVSCSLHLTHTASDLTPLLCRFSPSGSAFWMIDHRKTFICGEHSCFHTSRIQSKVCVEHDVCFCDTAAQ